MSWRDLHHNPIIFWGMTLITLASIALGFWAWWDDKPSREISYYHESIGLVNVEAFGSTELSLDGQRILEGAIYQNRLFIWNSGNQELTSDDFGEPIQWSNVPFGIQWSDLPIKTDMTFHGIRKDQVEGDLIPGLLSGGLRFKKLYPKTGLLRLNNPGYSFRPNSSLELLS